MEKKDATCFNSMEASAKRIAAKICGTGTCMCACDCGHTNKVKRLTPLIGAETECPLARYHVEPDKNPRPWWELDSKELEVTEDEIYILCACCPHGEVQIDKDGTLYVKRIDFYAACLDCPVKAVEDGCKEHGAES